MLHGGKVDAAMLGYILLAIILGLLVLLVLAIILEIRDRKLERQQLPTTDAIQSAYEEVDLSHFDEGQ